MSVRVGAQVQAVLWGVRRTTALSIEQATVRAWITHRCIDAFRNEYEDWRCCCERSMTREEMLRALAKCEAHWPDYAFRGHHMLNQRPGSDRLRVVT